MNATNYGKCLGMHFRDKYFITNMKNECHHFVNGFFIYKHHAIGHFIHPLMQIIPYYKYVIKHSNGIWRLILALNYLAFAIK
jgi:hypothetical protein